MLIIHLPLSTDAVSTPSLHPLVNSPAGVQCTLITTGSCLLKGEPEKSLSLITFNHTPNSNDLTSSSLIGVVETQYSTRKKRTAGGSKVVVINVVRLPRHYHLPSSSISKVSFVLPTGIWDCRFVFIRSDIFIDRQGWSCLDK